ncbi:hypothetical protein A2G09_17405 [Salmonella enterica subsp. enterica serovar Teddington]|nr:hypothetical protein [Salmonella enterica subsp. enterica serovar Teddington]
MITNSFSLEKPINNIIEIYRFILMKKNRCVIYSTRKILNAYFIIINIININVFVKIREPQRKYTKGN